MKVREAMTTEVVCCPTTARLNEVAAAMWERDCGFVPVTEPEGGKLAGVVTDRDVCMAAYTQGRPLQEIPVGTAMASVIVSCGPDDEMAHAIELLRRHQLHRLVVVDAKGELVGVLSLSDLARKVSRARGTDAPSLLAQLGRALADIGKPRELAATG